MKLLVVDDEEEIRSGIQLSIPWAEHGIECLTARDGEDALRVVHAQSPEIMLLDIRMPGMDGLSVMEHLKAEGVQVRTIIISGYDDFSYAQKALQLGAADYLLKPCRKSDLLKTILHIRNGLESDQKTARLMKQLQNKLEDNLPLLRERYLTRLLEADYDSKEKILENFRFLQIGLHPASLLIAIISIDYLNNFTQEFSAKDAELMKFAICNITQELMEPHFPTEIITFGGELVAFLSPAHAGLAQVRELFSHLKEIVKKNLGFSVSVGIGELQDDIMKTHVSYGCALRAKEAKFFWGADSIIGYDDIRAESEGLAAYPIREEQAVLNGIREKDEVGLAEAIDRYFQVLEAANSRAYLMRCGKALVYAMLHAVMENVSVQAGEGAELFAPVRRLDEMDTLDNVRSYVKSLAFSMVQKAPEAVKKNPLIEEAIQYISANYTEEISLKSAAASVQLSPAYFSVLFKQFVGVNFVDYLNTLRIKEACKLLKNARYKTYEVADKVGFNDEKYFGFIFKKITGLAPSRYREANCR